MANKTNQISPSLTTREQADWLRQYIAEQDVPAGQVVRQALKCLEEKVNSETGVSPYVPTAPMSDRIPMVLLDNMQYQFLKKQGEVWGSRATVIRTALQTLKGE